MIDLEKAKERLDAQELELKEISASPSASTAPVALDQQSVGRLSRMDAMQQQAMNKATEQKRRFDLVRIDEARKRLASGDYGFCDECGNEIPDGRLAIDPMAELCVNCAR